MRTLLGVLALFCFLAVSAHAQYYFPPSPAPTPVPTCPKDLQVRVAATVVVDSYDASGAVSSTRAVTMEGVKFSYAEDPQSPTRCVNNPKPLDRTSRLYEVRTNIFPPPPPPTCMPVPAQRCPGGTSYYIGGAVNLPRGKWQLTGVGKATVDFVRRTYVNRVAVWKKTTFECPLTLVGFVPGRNPAPPTTPDEAVACTWTLRQQGSGELMTYNVGGQCTGSLSMTAITARCSATTVQL